MSNPEREKKIVEMRRSAVQPPKTPLPALEAPQETRLERQIQDMAAERRQMLTALERLTKAVEKLTSEVEALKTGMSGRSP